MEERTDDAHERSGDGEGPGDKLIQEGKAHFTVRVERVIELAQDFCLEGDWERGLWLLDSCFLNMPIGLAINIVTGKVGHEELSERLIDAQERQDTEVRPKRNRDWLPSWFTENDL